MGTKPRFEPNKCKKLVSHSKKILTQGIINAQARDRAREIPGIGICGRYCEELVNVFQDLRNITVILQTVRRFTIDQKIAFGNLRSCIEHRLLCLPKQCPYHGTRESECVYESTRLAALIYVNFAFRSFAPVFPFLVVLKRSLMQVFERKEEAELNIASEDDISSGTVLWIYSIGAILALSDVEKEWFAARLARVIAAMGLESWNGCDYQLKTRFLWTDKMSDVIYQDLYHRIEWNLTLVRAR